MLTGEAPFRAATAAASLARVCSYRPLPAGQLRAEVPAAVSALVERLLQKEPNGRPRDAGEVASLLAEAGAGHSAGPPQDEGTIEALPRLPRTPGAEPSSATFPRSRRGVLHVAAAFAGGLLLALTLALVLAWQGGRLAISNHTPGTYELYERGLAELRRYDRAGHLEKAIADFREVIARAPDHAAAHAALARACQLQFLNHSKDRMWLDQALPLAERAVALDGYLASARVPAWV